MKANQSSARYFFDKLDYNLPNNLGGIQHGDKIEIFA